MGQVKHLVELLKEKEVDSKAKIVVFCGEEADAREKYNDDRLDFVVTREADGADQAVYGSAVGSGFVRGTGDDAIIQQAMHVLADPDPDPLLGYNNFRACIFEYVVAEAEEGINRSFVLAPVVPQEGDSIHKRLHMVKAIVDFLRAAGLEKPKLGALTGTRSVWRKHSASADRFSREAEILVAALARDSEYKDKVEFLPPNDSQGEDNDLGFEIERLLLQADIILAFDGSVGNIISRTLSFVAQPVSLYAIPWFRYGEIFPIGEGGFLSNPDIQRHVARVRLWQNLRKTQAA
ncbi:MAG TPA: hypothetical protein ENI68_11265 [Gammaproteobacteria bacterium]|nr:hypothetical protein [Gammaproteobacteria bacterium]